MVQHSLKLRPCKVCTTSILLFMNNSDYKFEILPLYTSFSSCEIALQEKSIKFPWITNDDRLRYLTLLPVLLFMASSMTVPNFSSSSQNTESWLFFTPICSTMYRISFFKRRPSINAAFGKGK